jgi:hypothetical protein
VSNACPSSGRMSLTLCSRYFHDQSIDPDGHIDPDTIWTGLCEGDETATAWTKAFFSDYVEHSVRPVMVLGPREYEDKRMVNSASTLLAMWRKLVKEADLTVLKAKRKVPKLPCSAECFRYSPYVLPDCWFRFSVPSISIIRCNRLPHPIDLLNSLLISLPL